ncbi:hypothetical protein DUNSADRAFT_1302 [Dunaliella salina]|uniref:Uncharacterized protein n=1 Tax=Dunaliella salina TaxID=3046 RepID=A0ABQ7FXS7_DUNSA|nr:hypothetical protein DUNSADRAFT_1302 [Dunaliella salina]KAF5827127.1 hypothetical protein DUNSADRAFT_1302 [Dunaliella salina]|eukprot:KAF5827126.1 hypothetical protein DUNSADRAFT_1302 [Dunaliella salina]
MGCSASIHKDPGVEEAPAPAGRAGIEVPPSAQASSREHPSCPSVPPAVEDLVEAGTQTGPRRRSGQNKPEAPQLPDSARATAPAADVMAAPGQVLEDVAGTARAAHASIEERIGAVAQTREEWTSSIESYSEDLATRDVDIVLDGAEQLVHLFRSVCGKGQQEHAALPDIQSLQLPKRTRLEQFFAKYSALGQVLVDMAGPAMEAMPFGAPAAAVIGAVYARAAQAARLSRNCEMLLGLMKSVDAQLARVLDSLASRRMKAPSSVESGLQELLLQIVQGGRLMQVGCCLGVQFAYIHYAM